MLRGWNSAGKFAGVEGLRGCCLTKAVVEDRTSLIRTVVPPPLQYPLTDVALPFLNGMFNMFYGPTLASKVLGLLKST